MDDQSLPGLRSQPQTKPQEMGQGVQEAPAIELPHLLDIEGVAEHLGVNVRHIRRLVAERRIPFVKWGHLLRFDPVEVSAWLDQWRRGGGRGSIVS